MDADQSAALQLHNQVRAEVSVVPLAWNDNLAAWALQYANELASLDRGMNHCKQLRDIKQGENLAICSGPWANPLIESSKLWYAEKKDWPGGVIQAQGVEKWGHYTQMIWSNTTLIGMAHAVAASGATYVAARYILPGNRMGDSPTANAGGAQMPAQNQMPAQTQMPAQAQIPAQDLVQQPSQALTKKKAKQKPLRNKYMWPEPEDPERENKYMRGPQAYNRPPYGSYGPYGPYGPDYGHYGPFGPFTPGMRPPRHRQAAVGCAIM